MITLGEETFADRMFRGLLVLKNLAKINSCEWSVLNILKSKEEKKLSCIRVILFFVVVIYLMTMDITVTTSGTSLSMCTMSRKEIYLIF